MNKAVVIRTYKGSQGSIQRQYQSDAPRFLQQGYSVESQDVIPGRRGCFGAVIGVLLLGIPFLLYRPKDAMVVTYRLTA